MNARRCVGAVCIVALGALLIGMAAPEGQFVSHAVKKGETVSLLCIELYGHYEPAMGDALRKDNADLKDINVIRVGQTIKLRNPSYKPVAAPDSAAARIFETTVSATQGVVTYLEGTATLLAKGAKPGAPLQVNALVVPGDQIQTGAKGRVEIIVNRETVVRIRENSRITIQAFRDNTAKRGTTRMNFGLGTVWTRVKKFKQAALRFQLEMPTAIAGVHGTMYQATVKPDSATDVQVYEGEVEVAGSRPAPQPATGAVEEVGGPSEVPGPQEVSMEAWTQIVRTMQQIRIDKKGTPSAPEPFVKKAEDEWVKWNEERDRRLSSMMTEAQ